MATAVETRGVRVFMRVTSIAVLAFLFVPIAVIFLYAFNSAVGQKWPPSSLTTHWFGVAWNNKEVRTALLTSLKAALGATAIALALGSLAAFAVHRFRFFGREALSFVLVLPIALPGIITGLALNSAISSAGLSFSLWTIVVGHATFCVVVVYNNVIARLRRTPGSLVEASMDLGADGWQTFRYVLWPNIATALVAGGLLAFALSFDEVVVTIFTAGPQVTLPIWIFNNLLRPTRLPQVNVVAMVVVIASFVPVYLAVRLTREPSAAGGVFREPVAAPSPEEAVAVGEAAV
jgi:putative spermidine/putrescine transport system permease protein